MESNIRCCIIFLLFFFTLRGNEARSEGHTTHMMHSNNVLAFFKPEDLKLGAIMPDQPLITPESQKATFLPRQKADSIPLSLSELPSLLYYFGFAPSSSKAKAVVESLSRCESEPIEGETKFCATSLESMLDSVNRVFEESGITTGFTPLNTKLVKKIEVHDGQTRKIINEASDNYYTVVAEPEPVDTRKAVLCHSLPYPYALYFCHNMDDTENAIKVYKVLLKGEKNGELIEAISVCHMDSSLWEPTHSSFTMWGIKRGSPACHFFASSDIVWVPLSSNNQGSVNPM